MHSIWNCLMGTWQRGLLTMLLSVAALVGVAFAPVALAQKTFGSPEEGMKELAAAAKAHDSKAMFAVLGNGAKARHPLGRCGGGPRQRRAFRAGIR